MIDNDLAWIHCKTNLKCIIPDACWHLFFCMPPSHCAHTLILPCISQRHAVFPLVCGLNHGQTWVLGTVCWSCGQSGLCDCCQVLHFLLLLLTWLFSIRNVTETPLCILTLHVVVAHIGPLYLCKCLIMNMGNFASHFLLIFLSLFCLNKKLHVLTACWAGSCSLTKPRMWLAVAADVCLRLANLCGREELLCQTSEWCYRAALSRHAPQIVV